MISLLTHGATLWTAAVVGLAGVVAHQLMDDRPSLPDDDGAPAAASVDAVITGTDIVAQLPSDDFVDVIVARPLFSPSRRPAPPAPPATDAAQQVVDEKPTLELIGTLLADDAHIALVQHPADGLLRLKRGQSVGGWTVVDVQPRRVRLENEEGLDVLTIRKDRVRSPSERSVRKLTPPREDGGGGASRNAEETPAPESGPIRRPM